MIPEAATLEEFKDAVLANCIRSPYVGEVYKIGILGNVYTVEEVYNTHLIVKLMGSGTTSFDWEDWDDLERTGQLRYLKYDP